MIGRRPPIPAPARRVPRRGFGLIEGTVAVLLLVVALGTTVKALSWVARQRLALDRRAVALREAENLLDRLTSGDPSPPSLSPGAGASLPDGSVEVDRRVESLDGVELERITVIVRYRGRAGEAAAPERLTTWVAPTPTDPGEGDR
ncbi:hypothetical protein [Tautonia plasticadhaerens]|uniref:Uncharacterized protein n=1 Tax=Tautonia plasticadhaerens TaxID=2527974 RepID=A0A518GWS2_9BACT|nr:hypothetical protein [Tautonia plasticadhaerens]QDV33039.1 hypothetical protein ElP_08810 [Tautonia plasticadhaerens]